MKTELIYTLALSYLPGIGVMHGKEIISNYETAENFWKLPESEIKKLFSKKPKIIENFQNKKALKLAEAELRRAESLNIKSYSYKSDDYPRKLKFCTDAPLVLFTKGNLDFNHGLFLSVVGTRKITAYGKMFINDFISELVNQPVTIISGLAMGCDVEAHRAAMKYNLQTFAVLAHGLNEINPKINQKEGIAMQEKGGLISEFSTFVRPEPFNFIQRNRIIAGLCDAAIIVESDFKGGAMSTARFANEYNREVFAVPGRVNDKSSRGCNRLIFNNQAILLRGAPDLMKYFNLGQKKESIQKELFVELSEQEKLVYEYLTKNGKTQIDEMAVKLNLPIYELNSALLEMELKGVINAISGNLYELK